MGQIDQCIFGSVILVARTRRKKIEENSVDILAKFACGQVSSPRLYRLNKNWIFFNKLKALETNKILSLNVSFLIEFTIYPKTD